MAVHYPRFMYLWYVFAFCEGKIGGFSVAEKISIEVLSVPMDAIKLHL